MEPRIIFLCLFLATYCLASPIHPSGIYNIEKLLGGDIVLDEVIENLFRTGTDIQTKIITTAEECVKYIDELMSRLENKLASISADIEVIDAEKIKIVHEAFESYRKSKLALRIARNKLMKLGHKTILTTDDLILYMEGWDKNIPVDEQKAYLDEQIKIMKILVDDSKDILEDAQTTYDQAYADMDSVILTLKSFKNGLKRGEEKLREGLYDAATGVTIGMIILDIFGCLGFCSLITTTTTWSTVKSQIHQLEKKMDRNIKDVSNIIEHTESLKRFIDEETRIIIKWDNEVDRLSGRLHYVKEENFYRLPLKRNALTNSLKGLRDIAQKFVDRPEGIFGETLV